MMNIGVLTVNDFSFHPNMRLKQAAEDSGHEMILINPYDILSSLKDGRFEWVVGERYQKIDAIMPRQGSPMGDYGLVLLRQFMHSGIRLVNGLKGVTIARNQFITLQALAASGLPVPSTIFITKPASFLPAVEQVGGFPVVVKQVDGMGGDGVIKVDRETDVQTFLTQNLAARKGLVVQQFISPDERTDIRVLVVGDKIAGAMSLVPDHTDFRANIHQKGHAKPVELTESMALMALKAAKACDLQIAGIDLIVEKGCSPLILEVNYSPGFRGLEAATGKDIAKMIIDHVTSTCNKECLTESSEI